MVADVLEVPVGLVLARDARLPQRVVPGEPRGRRRQHFLDRLLAGHVREGEALRGEAHARAAHILQRAPVAADGVVGADAAVGAERQVAPVGRGGDVQRVDAARADELGQQLAEQLAPRHRGVEPHHRRLLLDLAVPAQDGQARACRQRGKHVCRLARDARAEMLVGDRVVEVGEHEVLPHEDAQLVAEVVEGAGLIRAGSGQA